MFHRLALSVDPLFVCRLPGTRAAGGTTASGSASVKFGDRWLSPSAAVVFFFFLTGAAETQGGIIFISIALKPACPRETAVHLLCQYLQINFGGCSNILLWNRHNKSLILFRPRQHCLSVTVFIKNAREKLKPRHV